MKFFYENFSNIEYNLEAAIQAHFAERSAIYFLQTQLNRYHISFSKQ